MNSLDKKVYDQVRGQVGNQVWVQLTDEFDKKPVKKKKPKTK